MTYARLEELRAIARGEIARLMAEVTPSSGRGVIVQSGLVTVQPDAQRVPEIPEEKWIQGLYIKLTISSSLSDETVLPLGLAGHVGRSSGAVIASYVWDQTQIIQTQPDEGEAYSRSFKMELESRTYEPGDSRFDKAIYRLPIRVTIEEIEDTLGPTGAVIRTHEITVGRAGATRTFAPSSPQQNTILRLKSITRV